MAEAAALPAGLRGVWVGSGSDGMNEAEVAEAILALAPSPQPRVLYLGAATYDAPGPRERQTVRFAEAGCFVMSLDLAIPKPDEGAAVFQAKLVKAVGAAEVIIVSGGNTLYAADRFIAVGLLPLLRQAMERGCVLTGGSAGAICWFEGGHSDSMDPESYLAATLGAADTGGDESSAAVEGEAAKPWEYIRIPCLGLRAPRPEIPHAAPYVPASAAHHRAAADFPLLGRSAWAVLPASRQGAEQRRPARDRLRRDDAQAPGRSRNCHRSAPLAFPPSPTAHSPAARSDTGIVQTTGRRWLWRARTTGCSRLAASQGL